MSITKNEAWDFQDPEKTSTEAGNEWVESHNALFYCDVSAKKGQLIREIVEKTAESILYSQKDNLIEEPIDGRTVQKAETNEKDQKSGKGYAC